MTPLPVEVRIVWGASSHRGARRLLNEDSYLAQGSAFFVADGMGGHDAGEVASAAAVSALRPLCALDVVSAAEVHAALVTAQDLVRGIETTPGRGAGTTVSGVVVAEQEGVPYWLVVNVGDSRTYQLAGGVLEQVSVDHSEVQEMVEAGVITRTEALTHPRRHVVTRALGSARPVEADYWYLPVHAGDRLLVCSDGLSGELSDERIAEVLLEHPDPQTAADRLVHEAIVAGGRDNITVLVVDASGPGAVVEQTAPRDADGVHDEDTLPREMRFRRGELS